MAYSSGKKSANVERFIQNLSTCSPTYCEASIKAALIEALVQYFIKTVSYKMDPRLIARAAKDFQHLTVQTLSDLIGLLVTRDGEKRSPYWGLGMGL